MKKLRCAISQCLLGEKVRYDGREKLNTFITQELSQKLDWLAVCPEVEIGLFVPRPPIQLIDSEKGIRAVFVHDESHDFTDALQDHAHRMQEKLLNVDGYILKARSPSCGIGTVPVQGEKLLTNGIFVEEVKKILPDLPLIDEEQIVDKNLRDQFFRTMLSYRTSRMKLSNK